MDNSLLKYETQRIGTPEKPNHYHFFPSFKKKKTICFQFLTRIQAPTCPTVVDIWDVGHRLAITDVIHYNSPRDTVLCGALVRCKHTHICY